LHDDHARHVTHRNRARRRILPRIEQEKFLARATGSAMAWAVVSDVNADVLSAFVQRLSKDE
jgi:hypothetical protein